VRRRSGLFIAAAAVLAVAGCSGDDNKPVTLPSPTRAATSSTASPSASASGPSANPTAQAAKAAEVLVRTFFAELNSAFASGSTVRLKPTYLASCALCDQLAVEAVKFKRAGQTLQGGRVKVIDVGTNVTGAGSVQIVSGSQTAPGTVVNQIGEVVERIPRSPVADFAFHVEQRNGQWRIAKITALGPRR
jgi:ABC-type transporter MlaC component